eukprot:gene3674-4191_t
MAKYVIAGKSDCPFYANAELLADELQARLQDFQIHKIVIKPEEWDKWVEETCRERNWSYSGKSPMIWRELLDRGGKGILVGNCKDFLEIANGYYGIRSNKLTEELKSIAEENKTMKEKDDDIISAMQKNSTPFKICVTSAVIDVAYHVALELCNNSIFTNKEEIVVYLLDNKENLEQLQGMCMELIDCAPVQLKEAVVTNDVETAFKGANLILILDGYKMVKDESAGDSYKDILENIDFTVIKQYGTVANGLVHADAKILVAGGPCNLICNMLLATAVNLKRKNITALSRFDSNRSKSLIAKRLNVKTSDVKDLVIWGQPGYKQITDVSWSRVTSYDGAIWGPHIEGFSQNTKELVHDDKWLSKQLPDELQQQKDDQLKALMTRKMTLSNAAAIIDQLRDVYNCSNTGEIYSLAVASEGWYEVPTGLVFSFPIKLTDSGYEIISSLNIEEDELKQVKELGAELKENYDAIMSTYGLSMTN